MLLEGVVRADPKNARAYETLGLALKELGFTQASVAAARRAVQISPNNSRAWHNLGQAEMAARDFSAAEHAYQSAVRLQPSSDVSWIGLGNALLSQERADAAGAAFERAIRANPSNTDAHRLYNEMLWQTGREQYYLQSYAAAIRSRPTDPTLRLSFANELLRANQAREAVNELTAAHQFAPYDARIDDALARALAITGDFDQAVSHHARAIGATPNESLFTQNLLETLLDAGRYAEALDASTSALDRFRYDQGILALHTTALQLAGEFAKRERLADFARMPKVLRVDPPEGFSDERSFNAALSRELRQLHATKKHPTDQTLRGGTQTFGALFDRSEPLVVLLRQQIEKAIARYVRELPDDPTHPFFGRKAKSFSFSGSWSVRLQEGGFHTNHFHPKGWISSAYYVSLPSMGDETDRHPGWFKIGEATFHHGTRGDVQRFIRPEVGQLVLFPSYFWHGTVPFQTTGERLTVAFDVVPT